MNKRSLLLWLLLVSVCLMPAAAFAQGDGETVYRALLIGIDGYQNNALSGCVSDANRMATTLQAANEAGAFYQSPVIRSNLQTSEISDLFTETQTWNVDEDDVTFFFFAGHGYISDKGTPAIVGKDNKMLAISSLRQNLDGIPGVKVVVFDCRYADSLIGKGAAGAKDAVAAFNQAVVDEFAQTDAGARYYVLSASTLASSETEALSANEEARGLATYLLTEACGYDYINQITEDSLSGDVNGNGAVSLAEACDYIQNGIDALVEEKGEDKIVSNVAIYPANSAYPVLARRATSEVLEVTLEQGEVMIAAGLTRQMVATTQPANASMRSLYWTSSDLSVATVDADGVVTGVRPGAATIAATTANGLTVTAEVVVRDVKFVDSIVLTAGQLALAQGTKTKLDMIVEPSYANEGILWSSDNPGIATVDQNGNIECLALGETYVTARSENGVEATCHVQVVSADQVVTALRLSKTEASLYVGQSEQFAHQVKPESAANQNVTFVSSDSAIASVDASSGVVTGEGAGTATITATASSGITVTAQIRVLPAEIKLSKTKIVLKNGKSAGLKTQVKPKLTDGVIAWSTSDAAIATVENGKITAHSVGECQITATLPTGESAVCAVEVEGVVVKGVKLNHARATMEMGNMLQLETALNPDNASIKTITWKSSNENVAQVDDAGMVTAVGAGKAVVVARAHNGKSARCQIQVKPIAVTEVALNQTEATLVAGLTGANTITLTAETMPVSAGNTSLRWKSSNAKIATVSQTGVVTARGAGKAVISCTPTTGSKAVAKCNITVEMNATANKKPVLGTEEALYSSLKSVYYKKGYLVVQLFFSNRTKSAVAAPPAGTVVLTLADGETIEIAQVKAGKKKLAAGKNGALEFKLKSSGVEALEGLDLRGATAQLVREGETVGSTAPATPAAAAPATQPTDDTIDSLEDLDSLEDMADPMSLDGADDFEFEDTDVGIYDDAGSV